MDRWGKRKRESIMCDGSGKEKKDTRVGEQSKTTSNTAAELEAINKAVSIRTDTDTTMFT
jgi:hypothetical protein